MGAEDNILYTIGMDWLANLIDVSRLAPLSGAGDALREPRGLFVLLALVVLVLYGLSVGKTRALASLLSIYVAYVLTVLFPFFERLRGYLPERAQPAAAALVFLCLYVLTFLALSRATVRGRLSLGEISLPKVIIISIIQLGLLASILLSLLPPEFAERGFGPLGRYIAGQYALWGWAVVSLAILPFMRAHRKD